MQFENPQDFESCHPRSKKVRMAVKCVEGEDEQVKITKYMSL